MEMFHAVHVLFHAADVPRPVSLLGHCKLETPLPGRRIFLSFPLALFEGFARSTDTRRVFSYLNHPAAKKSSFCWVTHHAPHTCGAPAANVLWRRTKRTPFDARTYTRRELRNR